MPRKPNAIIGGAPMPLDRKKDLARCFGQDLMRGEHVVGAQPGLTWVGGNRLHEELDETSRKILAASQSGTSIFDPVLCELAYSWFCPPGGLVLDPFAGGSVRGIVASKLGLRYIGIDLSERQLVANREQAIAICSPDRQPVWIEGDSTNIRTIVPAGTEADFIFSCPPYADLELYSDDQRDLSTMDYEAFRSALGVIISETCALLKEDRFACFVVGDVRDAKGFYHGFPWHTVESFQNAGLKLYNEAVLVTAVGSLPIRVGRAFSSSRKLGKTHQNVLVFVKGDPKKATEACGPVDLPNIGDSDAIPVKVSSAMARLPFNGCEPEYIRTTCHAACCHSTTHPSGTMITIHPSEEDAIKSLGGIVRDGFLQAVNKRCPFKQHGSELCGLHNTQHKPFGCISSPFTINDRNTLIVRNRYKLLKCYNDGNRLPAYIAFRASLDLLFGTTESARICASLDSGGGDLTAYMPIANWRKLRENDAVKRSHSRSS